MLSNVQARDADRRWRTAPAHPGWNPFLNWRSGSSASQPGLSVLRREASLIIPFMRAVGDAFLAAWMPSLRGKFLAAEFMSCTFI